MTMHVYFNQDKDGYKKDWSGYVERTLARRFCENDIAIPYQKHLDNVYDIDQAEKKAKAHAEAEKKTELLKKKESIAIEKADSKNQKKGEKSVKKQ